MGIFEPVMATAFLFDILLNLRRRIATALSTGAAIFDFVVIFAGEKIGNAADDGFENIGIAAVFSGLGKSRGGAQQ